MPMCASSSLLLFYSGLIIHILHLHSVRKEMHIGMIMFVQMSAHLNSRTVEWILTKSDSVMLMETTPNFCSNFQQVIAMWQTHEVGAPPLKCCNHKKCINKRNYGNSNHSNNEVTIIMNF
jgi:hypothetical protein